MVINFFDTIYVRKSELQAQSSPHPSEERNQDPKMKATIFLLLLGALCWTSALAEESSAKKRKDVVDELVFAQDEDDSDSDGAIEKALRQVLAKLQGDEEDEGEGKSQDGGDDVDSLLALLQDEEDEGEGETVKEQGDDDDEGTAQILVPVKRRLCRGRRCRPPFHFPCRGRRCSSPLWRLKKYARMLISMGGKASSMGGRMLSMSSTLMRDGRSMGSMENQLKSLGRSMSSFGRKLLFFRWPYYRG